MTHDEVKTQRTVIEARFIERLADANTAHAASTAIAAAFQPSGVQASIIQSFSKGSHRMSFFTGTNKGNMALPIDVADEALNSLVENGYLTVLSGRVYLLTFKGGEFARGGPKPVTTPPRTFNNATTAQVYVSPKLNLRDGWDDHFRHKSMNPCAPQLQRVVA